MDLAPKTTDDLKRLVAELREMGVAHFAMGGVTLTLTDPRPAILEGRVEASEEPRGQLTGLTAAEQMDAFNSIIDPVKGA